MAEKTNKLFEKKTREDELMNDTIKSEMVDGQNLMAEFVREKNELENPQMNLQFELE